MTALKPSFLGRGFAFPLRLDATQSRPAFSEDEERVKESIHAFISTDIGERPFRVRNGVPYGTRFRSLLFTNSVEAAADIAKFDIKRGLATWEPRIIVLDVTVDTKFVFPGTRMRGLLVNVPYRYRATNRLDNFVRPYRLQPAGGET